MSEVTKYQVVLTRAEYDWLVYSGVTLEADLAEAVRLLQCDDIFVSAEQQMAWRTERDAFLKRMEDTNGGVSCDD